MLATDRDRLDYGQQLAPPEGYVLDAAVATTYSLDLDALLAVPIALCFNNTLEGDLKGEKLALLEAMAQLKGKLKVFYQKGNIKIPASYNRLFTLLEPCLEAVLPAGGAFSSFHPKVWLLRFIDLASAERGAGKRSKVKYRLLVLSRNLTFDRSWDIALSLDGERVSSKSDANGNEASWLALFRDLLGRCDDFAAADTLLQELPKIYWEVPAPFGSLELRAGGPSYGQPIAPADSPLSDLLVVSPFIKSQGGGVDGLQQLLLESDDTVTKTLCSRAEELNAIGEEKLAGWDCYAINPCIVSGEESLELSPGSDEGAEEGGSAAIQPQNLHAKLVVREYGNNCDWLLGSANATSAALGQVEGQGQGGVNPRNTEIMATLSGRKKVMRPKQLLNSWIEQELFVPHDFEDLELENNDSLVAAMRQLSHDLLVANWSLHAALRDDGKGYDLRLSHNFDAATLDINTRVTVSQLDLQKRFDLQGEEPLLWPQAQLGQLTAFVIVSAEITSGEQCEQWRGLIHADLTIEGGDHRQQQLLQSMVGPAKILNYVRLLLHTQPDKAQWLGFEPSEGDATEALSALLSSDEPLFEQLMIAAARHPEVITRIDKLMARLRVSEVKIPEELSDLWQHFEPFASAKKTKTKSVKSRNKKKGGGR